MAVLMVVSTRCWPLASGRLGARVTTLRFFFPAAPDTVGARFAFVRAVGRRDAKRALERAEAELEGAVGAPSASSTTIVSTAGAASVGVVQTVGSVGPPPAMSVRTVDVCSALRLRGGAVPGDDVSGSWTAGWVGWLWVGADVAVRSDDRVECEEG
ncbi:hypothetical protein PHYPSEUDO_006753 [Phytophthora pseudosyringae]|uniref:Uncharacterized protein n=1 Tax=Phytophthora pseudosyringae TaxID=221518 RepID=A0A8T1VKY3_9STRA|nr:hypothetical protein PHYPSEUDO_006753 [Phytophthora pseudosyringae]